MSDLLIVRGVPGGFGHDCRQCRMVCCQERGHDPWLADDFEGAVARHPALGGLVTARGRTVVTARPPAGCVFCEGGLCAIERDVGRERKPLLCLTYPLRFALAPGAVIWYAAYCSNASLAAAQPVTQEQLADLEERWAGRWEENSHAPRLSRGSADDWRRSLGRLERALHAHEEARPSGLEELTAAQRAALGSRPLAPGEWRRLEAEAQSLWADLDGAVELAWHEALPCAVEFVGFQPAVMNDGHRVGDRLLLLTIMLGAWAGRLAAAEGCPVGLGHVETALTLVMRGEGLGRISRERHSLLWPLLQRAFPPGWRGLRAKLRSLWPRRQPRASS